MRVVQNIINNQEFRKRKRGRELGFYSPMITKAPRYRAMSQQASCRSFPMFWGCYTIFLLMNQRMSQVVSLSHMLWVPQSSKTGAEKFPKSNRLCINKTNLRPGSQIPDVVYHVMRWKRQWVSGVGTAPFGQTEKNDDDHNSNKSTVLRSKERSNGA